MSEQAPPRKFLSEHAVGLFTSYVIVLPPDQLHADGEMPEDAAKVSPHCHIYLICRRPSISIDPASFKYNGKRVFGNLLYRVSGQQKSARFEFPFALLDGATSVEVGEYPHRELVTFGERRERIRSVPSLFIALGTEVAELSKLEVLYVGQAYADGKRSAIDRLRSHSTLQRVLAETTSKKPDDEILLLLFKYEPYRVFTSMDGISKAEIVDDRDKDRFLDILANPLSEHAQICLAEAALIRYFQPPYNAIFKEGFPNSSQKILSECYKLDFSGLIVEIDTEDLRMSLYSASVSPDDHHTAKFDLHKRNVRRSFFAFPEPDGSVVHQPGVITPSR